MKKYFILIVLLIAVHATRAMCQEEEYSLSIGLGPLYSGLGVGYRTSLHELNQYFSIGCPSLGYGSGSGWLFRCGVGYSILANLTESKQHSLGFNVGVLYRSLSHESGMEYLAGVFYTYFFNAADREGWSMQLGPGVSYFDNEYTPVSFFGFGYQY